MSILERIPKYTLNNTNQLRVKAPDVYIDDIYYHDVDKFDIEETIESIITNYILFKNNSAHIISPKEYEKVIKKDESAHIFKFNNV